MSSCVFVLLGSGHRSAHPRDARELLVGERQLPKTLRKFSEFSANVVGRIGPFSGAPLRVAASVGLCRRRDRLQRLGRIFVDDDDERRRLERVVSAETFSDVQTENRRRRQRRSGIFLFLTPIALTEDYGLVFKALNAASL